MLSNSQACLRNIVALASRTRIFSVLQRATQKNEESGATSQSADRKLADKKTAGENSTQNATEQDNIQLAEEVKTRLDNGVGPDAYQRDNELAEKIVSHFRFNLERMIEIANSVDARIIFVTPASNLADSSPFKSQHGSNFRETDAWQQRFDAAQDLYRQDQFESAVTEISQAIELSPQHAHSHFWHGRILRQLKRYDEAKDAFIIARDQDVCPLRAWSSQIDIMRQVAAEKRIPLVDFVAIVDQQSPQSLPGENVFLDHVHPTIAGNRLLALKLFEQMCDLQIVEQPDDWTAKIEQVVSQVESRIDAAAHGAALRNLSKVLLWAGKQEEANLLAIKADSLLVNDAETIYLAGNALMQQGKTTAAEKKFRQALSIDPDHVLALNSLGTSLLQQRRIEEARSYFIRAVELNRDFAPAHNNLGALYSQIGNSNKAIEHYREAIRLNPNYSKAYNNIGTLLRQQKS